jgi:hypothetical protein
MKKLIILLMIASVSPAWATATSAAQKSTATVSASGEKADVGTDFRFDDLTVHGQYQSANEGLVTVENDKDLNNLLDYRTDYKDRLKASRLNPVDNAR